MDNANVYTRRRLRRYHVITLSVFRVYQSYLMERFYFDILSEKRHVDTNIASLHPVTLKEHRKLIKSVE